MRTLLACTLVLLGSLAFAEANLEEAKRHFKQGVMLYNDGNFKGALAEFERTYEIQRNPGVFYNIGLTHKSLHQYNEAIDTLSRYLAEDPKIARDRRQEVMALVTDMRSHLTEVTFVITPESAQLTIDGRPLGREHWTKTTLAAGHYSVEVKADGHRPLQRDVMVATGVPVTVTLKLEAAPRMGKIRIEATQPNAMVKIDGQTVGPAPQDIELSSGGHQLEVSSKGRLPHRTELVVAAGQSRDLRVVLERKPVYERWYFWTPILAGVVVAGAVGIGVALAPHGLQGTLGSTVVGLEVR